MNGLLTIALAALCNASALWMLRMGGQGFGWESPWLSVRLDSIGWLLGGLAAYAFAFMLTVRILAQQSFAVAVPIFIGLQFVFTALITHLVLHETQPVSVWLGMAIILGGVALVAFGSS